MAEEPQRDRIGDTVRALFSPKKAPPSATVRVADLYCGDGRLSQAATNAGLEVVYSHTPKSWDEHLDISALPAFDLVTATLPDAVKPRAEVLEFVLRFLWVRRPNAFVLVGDSRVEEDNEFLKSVQDKTFRLGYRADLATTVPEMELPGEENLAFVVGTKGRKPFVWPAVARSKPEGTGDRPTINRRPNEGPPRTFALPADRKVAPVPTFGGSSVSVIRTIIQGVVAHVRED